MCSDARARVKETSKRIPALYVEAIKTLRANKHINAITVAGTILKKHTGVMEPEDWVGAITDKLGDFKVSDGQVEPSNRFLVRPLTPRPYAYHRATASLMGAHPRPKGLQESPGIVSEISSL
jgi:hypothetical protein